MTIGGTLFDRVVQILEQARSNVVQSVNTNMVTAYWLIGREIVVEIQGGKERAVYGKQVIETLSLQLTEQYGHGYSVPSVKSFRQFFLAFQDRFIEISTQTENDLFSSRQKSYPPGSQFATNFSPQLKSPMVLEFLNLPDDPNLHESKLEQAIIGNLQLFLLELGKGFSFVARQKHIRFDDDDFYVDLVFYNFILKCFLLIDLKLGKLTHQDVGQMDGYVRLFEDQFKVPGDNPTIGLILCSDKSETVAKYSVLHESKQIFASKYLKFLPTEEELKLEIEKERRLIEASLTDRKGLLSFDENSAPNAE